MPEPLVIKKMDGSLTKMPEKTYHFQLCMLVFWVAVFARDFKGKYLQLANKQAEKAHGAP